MPLVTTRLRLAANSAARSSSYGSLNDHGLLVKASLSYTCYRVPVERNGSYMRKEGAIKGPGWAQEFCVQ